MDEIPLDRETLRQLNNMRMLIFLETKPQSNKYNQILLTKQQFKEVSDALGKIFEVKGHSLQDGEIRVVDIEISDDETLLPDLQQIHDLPE